MENNNPPGNNPPAGELWTPDALRVRRVARGISRHDLAQCIDTTAPMIRRWEEGQPPQADMIRRLCKFFNVAPNVFTRDPRVV